MGVLAALPRAVSQWEVGALAVTWPRCSMLGSAVRAGSCAGGTGVGLVCSACYRGEPGEFALLLLFPVTVL